MEVVIIISMMSIFLAIPAGAFVFMWLEFGPARVGLLLRALRLHGNIEMKNHTKAIDVSSRVFLKALDKARLDNLVRIDLNGTSVYMLEAGEDRGGV